MRSWANVCLAAFVSPIMHGNPILDRQTVDCTVFQCSIVRHQRRAVFKRRTRDRQIEVALSSSTSLDIGAHDRVSPCDRKAQVEHGQFFRQVLNASPILLAPRRLLRAEQQLGQHEQRNADLVRLNIRQMGAVRSYMVAPTYATLSLFGSGNGAVALSY